MRTEVTVNGVKLTRAQIEAAMTELNKPGFKSGDLVRYIGPNTGPQCTEAKVFMVTGGSLKNIIIKAWGDYTAPDIITITDGSSSWDMIDKFFERVEL